MILYFQPSYRKGHKSYIVDVNECSYIPNVAIDTAQLSGFHKVSHDLTAIEDRNNQLARLFESGSLVEIIRIGEIGDNLALTLRTPLPGI